MKKDRNFVLLGAFLMDWLVGDPPNRYHPVAWMGSFISLGEKNLPRNTPREEFLSGAAITLGGSIFVGLIGWLLRTLFSKLPSGLRIIFESLILKTTLTFRGLDKAAGEVQTALENDHLQQARKTLHYHLVSRDTSELNRSQIAAAAIESIAENTSDSYIAPLFYYALGGLPLALVYRFINTADAMLGYKDWKHFWLGKFPARTDDLINLIPARLAGHLISISSYLHGDHQLLSEWIMNRDAHLTSSPNAGFPMGAMAGGLGVKLEKENHYSLGSELPEPKTTHLKKARKIFRTAAFLGLGLSFLFSLFRGKDACSQAAGTGK